MMAWDVSSLSRAATLPLPAAFLLQVCLLSWFLDLDNGALGCTGHALGFTCTVSLAAHCSCPALLQARNPGTEGKNALHPEVSQQQSQNLDSLTLNPCSDGGSWLPWKGGEEPPFCP